MSRNIERVQYGARYGLPPCQLLGGADDIDHDREVSVAAVGDGEGVTQGDPEFQMIFNIVIVEVVHAVLEEVYGPQEALHDLGLEEGGRNLVFYADGGWNVGSDIDWVKNSLEVIV